MNLKLLIKRKINATVDHRETYKKQSGGRGKFADIQVTIKPQTDPEKTGLEFINKIKGGNIPREFIPSVEKGFKAINEERCFSWIPN